MFEASHGIYLSTVATRSWRSDSEIGGEVDLVIDGPSTTAGLWRVGLEGPRVTGPVRIPQRETIYVVTGRVGVALDGQGAIDLRPGDMLSIPAGSMVGWEPSPECEVFWVYS